MTSGQKLKAQALRYIGLRSRTIAQFKTYLAKKTEDQNLINQITDEFIKFKFLDDDQYVKNYVSYRQRYKPRSLKMLSMELKQKGISVKEIADPEMTDLQTASEALERRQRSLSRYDLVTAKKKAIAFLKSRGYSWGVVEKVVAKSYNKASKSQF